MQMLLQEFYTVLCEFESLLRFDRNVFVSE